MFGAAIPFDKISYAGFVRINKSTDCCIKIPTTQIIQPNLFVVIITTVSEGVDGRNLAGGKRQTFPEQVYCIILHAVLSSRGDGATSPCKKLRTSCEVRRKGLI